MSEIDFACRSAPTMGVLHRRSASAVAVLLMMMIVSSGLSAQELREIPKECLDAWDKAERLYEKSTVKTHRKDSDGDEFWCRTLSKGQDVLCHSQYLIDGTIEPEVVNIFRSNATIRLLKEAETWRPVKLVRAQSKTELVSTEHLDGFRFRGNPCGEVFGDDGLLVIVKISRPTSDLVRVEWKGKKDAKFNGFHEFSRDTGWLCKRQVTRYTGEAEVVMTYGKVIEEIPILTQEDFRSSDGESRTFEFEFDEKTPDSREFLLDSYGLSEKLLGPPIKFPERRPYSLVLAGIGFACLLIGLLVRKYNLNRR